MRASAFLHRSRSIRTGATVLAVVLAASILPGGLAPAAADPEGTITLPAHDSAEAFRQLAVLAAGPAGIVTFTLPDGVPEGVLGWIEPDGTRHDLPGLPRSANVDGARMSGSLYTTVDKFGLVRRYDLVTKSLASGDGTALKYGFSLHDVTDAGWLETRGMSYGYQLTLRRPGRDDIDIAPVAGREAVALPTAAGSTVFWGEPGLRPKTIKMMDEVSGSITTVHTGEHVINQLWATPRRLVWEESRVSADETQVASWLCQQDRSADSQPTCALSETASRTQVVGVTETHIFYVASNASYQSFQTAPLNRPDDVAQIMRSGSPLRATSYPFAWMAGDGLAVLPYLDDSVQFVRSGQTSSTTLVDAPRYPASSAALALSAGRLVNADSRSFAEPGFWAPIDDNRYPTWGRSVTRSGSLAVGQESSYGPAVYRSAQGNSITVSGLRAVLVTSQAMSQPAACDVQISDGSTTVETKRLSRCDGMELSGSYFAAASTYAAGGNAVVEDLGGTASVTLPCAAPGTYALFGSRVAYATPEGRIMLRDLSRPLGATNPRDVGWASCDTGWLSMWGRFIVVAAPNGPSRIIDLDTGQERSGPAMHRPKVIDGAAVWQEAWGTTRKVFALDLAADGAAPVEVGAVGPYPGQFSADDHLVAWQDAASGSVKVAPLPFKQATPHPPRLLGKVAATSLPTKPSGEVTPWHVEFDVTKPLSAWKVDLRNPAGTVVKSWSGVAPQGGIRLDWDGKIGARWAPGGTYTWSLMGTAADGEGSLRDLDGAEVPLTGTLVVKDGKVRDLGSDRRADLLTKDPNGYLWRYDGTAVGGLSARSSLGSGWNTFSMMVSAGDMTGDGYPDLLGRDRNGYLWRYDGNGVGGVKSGVRLGTGWNAYTAIAGVGDISGDGRADLVARDAYGVLYRYDGTGTGNIVPRVRLGSGWNAFNALVGVGDFSGDGRADLVVRDTYGTLFRYDGTGAGSFNARVKIGSGWQTYNNLTGLNDFDGDGQADLIARDASGLVWRYRGDGKGTFLPRASMGTGFNIYSMLL